MRAFLFENGNTESWIKLRIQLDKLTCNMPFTTGAKKIKVAKAFLKGQAREYFIDMRTDFELNDDNKNDKEEYFVEAIEGRGSISSVLLPKELPQVPSFYDGYASKEFKTELLKHNNYLQYFPVPNNRKLVESLPNHKLVKIIDQAKRVKWQCDVLTVNINPYGMKLDEYFKCFKKLNIKHHMDKATQKLKEGKKADHK